MTSPPALTLPDDSPLNEAGRQKYSEYRLEPVIEMLHEMLDGWLHTSTDHRPQPPRIGLFGGLGQGKSSVLSCVLEKISAERKYRHKVQEWLFGSRIARFDVSFFKASDLEWRFLTAVLWQRVLLNLTTVLLAIIAVRCVLYLTTEDWKWMLGLEGVILAPPFFKVFSGANIGKVTKFNPADGLYLARRDLFIQSFARFMCASPDVVVVDDLDRASVEQQRAFLRAITRFSQELGFAVVVCIDESELLAAPPNPETPEELLRKTLTAELRVPDRSREDVALLVMSCVRQFAKTNLDHPLNLALISVSFVGDLTRVLLLETITSPTSPRKVLRLLARVALQAEQLKITDPDDLAALLRLDGLFQLTPILRRYMDELCQVLEVNRTEQLQSLLTKANVSVDRRQHVEHYFNRTRMMQPALRDGWFRLLGGFETSNNTQNKANGSNNAPDNENSAPPKTMSWDITPRSHEFFRLFLGAVELDASGYGHKLKLEPSSTANTKSKLRYEFEIPGGGTEFFALQDLPLGFQSFQDDYMGQCWLLWVCALTTTLPTQKYVLFERAFQWLGDDVFLRDLFWRECMADAEFWDSLNNNARRIWWNRAHENVIRFKNKEGEPLIKLERFFANPLKSDDFTESWHILVLANYPKRDGRKALSWWRLSIPNIQTDRLTPSQNIDLVSQIWSSPAPKSQSTIGWIEILTQHFLALNALNIPQFMPATLVYGWQRAQIFLTIEQVLQLLHCLAYDEKADSGMRWSTRAAQSWLEILEKSRISAIQAFVESDDLQEFNGKPDSNWRLTLILLAALRDWKPKNSISLVAGLPYKEVNELADYLKLDNKHPIWFPSF